MESHNVSESFVPQIVRSSALSRPHQLEPSTTCSLCWDVFLMRLMTDILTAYGYGYGGFTGTGPYYVPSGTAPFSSYGTASGAPYKTYNSSATGDPTSYPTHGPYPFPSGSAVYVKRSSNITVIASTGDPSAKGTGTAASTGFASAPSSFGTSGGYTYTAPKGIPTEYFYHHKKPKRNVSRLVIILLPSGRNILMDDGN